MQALMFDFQMWKVVLKKLHLGSPFLLTKFSDHWPQPILHHPNQIKIKTLLGGICASDLHQIDLHVSLYESILASPQNPFPLGHEIVGEIDQIGAEISSFKVGDRVVYTPMVACSSYGLPSCPSCANNNPQACYCLAGYSTDPKISAPFQKSKSFGGFGGGGFSEYFLGFPKQLFKVPDSIPDEHAVLTEPLAVAIHAVLESPPGAKNTVFVIGAGIIGLMTILVLKHFYPMVTVVSVARYSFQAKKALVLGASQVIQEGNEKKRKEEIAKLTHGKMFKPTLSSPLIYGEQGPDVIYDCVADEKTVNEALCLIKHHGLIVLIGLGLTVTKHIDWSLQIHKEVTIKGTFIHGIETYQNQTKHAFEWALELLSKYPTHFANLVTHRFPIRDFKKAISVARSKGRNEAIKIVFDYR
jgi:threonine dehydrogenase-like Zn-dependent dehydrogenase